MNVHRTLTGTMHTWIPSFVFGLPIGLGLALAGCGGPAGSSCISGAICTPDNACHTGATACGSGAPVCEDTHANVPTGTPCGAGRVCKDGAGDACTAGAVCTPDANLCHVGAVDCSTGAAACKDTGMNAAPRTGCGVNRFCTASGSCAACTLAKVCTDGIAPCHAGAIACDTGAAVCKDASNIADGTACTSGYCKAGACAPCVPVGADCGNGGQCTADGKCVLTVTGSARITYWPTGAGPMDLGNCFGQQAEVFSPDGNGGYTLLAPTNAVCTATNLTFTIPQPVPAGIYLLHFAGSLAYGNFYVETTQPTVDFGRDQAGRPDSNIDSSGLDPWIPKNDTLDFACGNVGVALAVAGSAFGLTDFSPGAMGGASVVDWKAQPLVDPAKGDVAWLYQMGTKPTGVATKSYLAVTRAAKLSGFGGTGGTPVTASPALAVVSASGSVALTWATSKFEALVVKANPKHAVGAHFISVDVVLAPTNPAKYTPASAHVQLLVTNAQPGQADLALGTLGYGQFLGAPWKEALTNACVVNRRYVWLAASDPSTRSSTRPISRLTTGPSRTPSRTFT